MEGFFSIFWLVILITAPIIFIMWSSQKKQLGRIQCNRCDHVGPPKGLWLPFRGVKPVCAKCHSEDWVKIQARQEPAQVRLPPSVIKATHKQEISAPAFLNVRGAPPTHKGWFYKVMGVELGPVSPSEFARLAQDGTITLDTEVCKGQGGKWVLAHKVKGLFEDDGEGNPDLSDDDNLLALTSRIVDLYEKKPAHNNPRLQPCPDCEQMVSKKAAQCPHCGCPMPSR
jgi:hypothetical protein